ncbi:MAG TPA: guanitoxin biosynthesis heme-dependent pre-guanitoxin N-hydroxylase GntA [Gemmatimonadaceae bacterium]
MTRMATRADEIAAAFRAFAGDAEYSCLAGRGVVHAGRAEVAVYGALGSQRSARSLSRDLRRFLAAPVDANAPLRAFVAVFPARPPRDELVFEQALWRQLALLQARDATETWDPSVADDPDDARFAFSFAGQALFVIGLHAASSRLARRFQWPALVFNPHAQFDRLRAAGHFERLRGMVREREVALQGSLNPNLADFGERSEARQYSGRAVESEWRCPFQRKT